MAAEGGSEETVSSPKNRVKFLCSHSGKIMPRPADGQLKYVGGETRVVAVPRDIDFTGLMNKLSGMCDGDMVLKYQLVPDEFDVLVSVKCDEDLHHMLSEYDRQEANSSEGAAGSPRLRTFLFPSHPIVLDLQPSSTSSEAQETEQRYVDAINGVLRAPPPITTTTTTTTNLKRSSLSNGRSIFSVSSASSSPTFAAQLDNSNNGTTCCPNDSIINTHDVFTSNGFGNLHLNKGAGFQRVSSSPSLYNLGQQSHYYPTHHHHHQQQQQQQQQPPHGHHCHRLPGPGNGTGRLVSALSVGRSDLGRYQVGHANLAAAATAATTTTTNAPCYQQARHLKGCGNGCAGCGHSDGRVLEVADSLRQYQI